MPFKESHPLMHDHFEHSKKRLLTIQNNFELFKKLKSRVLEWKFDVTKWRTNNTIVLETKNRSVVILTKVEFTKQINEVKC